MRCLAATLTCSTWEVAASISKRHGFCYFKRFIGTISWNKLQTILLIAKCILSPSPRLNSRYGFWNWDPFTVVLSISSPRSGKVTAKFQFASSSSGQIRLQATQLRKGWAGLDDLCCIGQLECVSGTNTHTQLAASAIPRRDLPTQQTDQKE